VSPDQGKRSKQSSKRSAPEASGRQAPLPTPVDRRRAEAGRGAFKPRSRRDSVGLARVATASDRAPAVACAARRARPRTSDVSTVARRATASLKRRRARQPYDAPLPVGPSQRSRRPLASAARTSADRHGRRRTEFVLSSSVLGGPTLDPTPTAAREPVRRGGGAPPKEGQAAPELGSRLPFVYLDPSVRLCPRAFRGPGDAQY
jgi:hypothetical protein